MSKNLIACLVFSLSLISVANCAQRRGNPDADQASETERTIKGEVLVTNRLDIDFSKHLITFIELGADRCIPCKAMQPIMKEIAADLRRPGPGRLLRRLEGPRAGPKIRDPTYPDPGLHRPKGQRGFPPRRAFPQGRDPRPPEEARGPLSRKRYGTPFRRCAALLQHNPWLAVVAVFFGGITTALNPCVLAMVPLLMSVVAGNRETTTVRRSLVFSLFFVLGLAVTFTALGLISALMGRMFGDVGRLLEVRGGRGLPAHGASPAGRS